MSSRTIEQSHREWRSNLERGCRYLRDGTLFGRLVSRWHEYRRAQRRRWWDNQQGHRAYYDVSLGRGVKMRLYLDDHLCRMIYCDDFEAAERLFLRLIETIERRSGTVVCFRKSRLALRLQEMRFPRPRATR